MDQKMLIVGAAVIVIAVAAFMLMQPKGTSTVQPNTQPPAQPPASGAKTAAVDISGFAFNPGTLTVQAGTTVTWTNNDPAKHTITSATFNGDVNSGATFSFKFDTAGTYNYHCSIHPSMTGQVIVQ